MKRTKLKNRKEKNIYIYKRVKQKTSGEIPLESLTHSLKCLAIPPNYEDGKSWGPIFQKLQMVPATGFGTWYVPPSPCEIYPT